MERVRVLAKGQIVIPAALRKKYGIEPGAELGIFEYGRLIHIVTFLGGSGGKRYGVSA